MKTLLALLLSLTALCARAELKEFKLPTAADGEVGFLVDTDTKLPVGASDDKARVTLAGLAFLPAAKGEALRWTWRYGVQFKGNPEVRRITVEDEKQKELKLLVQDDHPVFEGGVWTGAEAGNVLNKEVFELMNAKDTWMLMRRIVVTYADGSQSKLHQLIVQTQPMRVGLLERLMAPQRQAGQ